MASPTNHIRTGQTGEDLAAVYLQQAGYEIRQRNYRHRRAEVDIIAQQDDLLVFVEVKTRATNTYGYPEAAVNPQKEELLLQAAAAYIEQQDWQQDIRFDIIAVTMGAPPAVHHIQDAFH